MSRPPNSPFTDEQLGDDDSIRLLELQPGQRDSPIVIRLFVHNLTSAPPYEALSYVWGDPNKTEAIEIKSPATYMGPNTQLHVTTSCVMALRRLRSAEATRILWVDAICINQVNVPERNHQLTLMTRIYHNASRVVVYLGEKGQEDDSDAVMEWIQDLHAPSDAGETPEKPSNEVIQRFFGRRWFTRVWVIQEIKVARAAIVICGEKSVTWDAFEQVPTHLLGNAGSFVSRRFFTASSWQLPYPVRLLRLLESTREFGATDARDKMFAILPLVNQDTQQYLGISPSDSSSTSDSYDDNQPIFPTIRVNYSRSTSEVFAQLSRDLIDAIGLKMLLTVVTPTTIPNLPSWATDWTTNLDPREVYRLSRIKCLRHRELSHVNGLRDCTSPVTWSFSDYIDSDGLKSTQLEVSGNMGGTIRKLGDVCDIYEDIFPLEQWESLCDPIQRKAPFIQALGGERGIHIILGEIRRFNSKQLSRNMEVSGATYSSIHGKIEERGGEKLVDILAYLPPSLRHAAEDLFRECHSRRFYVTETGLLGLAPKSARI
ncbi:hypothetical protein GCG54_00000379 [Colletotrichum gloeosporioides]|uniref:Heterokaryon incompatibility domain-containing protein n=1 Tax=Colletotrichum gloeosporioides TaxID=474922 RepID=A0A8H4FRC3_COLGL|nr:uncharacterized protein GCG54_00000379 [Colletotrichum gloeosporioides]KAF3810334.1 hypothetical protein GCG54_00000379 [Colletotrichum gloeosporioides]